MLHEEESGRISLTMTTRTVKGEMRYCITKNDFISSIDSEENKFGEIHVRFSAVSEISKVAHDSAYFNICRRPLPSPSHICGLKGT